MRIGIASDHRGYILKEKLMAYLITKGYDPVDFGTNAKVSVDYPDFAFALGEAVVSGTVDFGLAICGSGIGISIACNKVKGVRCAKVDSISDAKYARLDNNANIMAISGTLPTYKAKDFVDAFFKTKYSGLDRHQQRIDKITEYEQQKPKRKTKKEATEKENEC